MKIGIITITDNNNFGNRLQCYALYKVLKKKNYNVMEIRNDNKSFVLQTKRFIRQAINILDIKSRKKRKKFRIFNKYIKRTQYVIDYNKPTEKEKFDMYIVGSDQVWNPEYNRLSNLDLLNFSTNAIKNSYAASFGLSNLTSNYSEKIKLLNDFKHISVREQSGMKIIDKFLNRKDVKIMLDPTLLLSKKEWHKLSEKADCTIGSNYIFLYFLGKLNTETKNTINQFALKKQLKIVNILDKNSEYYESGPNEFVSLIENASIIFTDSFHASVFSFIFQKPFVIFERNEIKNTYSRLENFLTMFSLKDRKFNGKFISNENLNVDYSKGYSILENKRNESIEYINSFFS